MSDEPVDTSADSRSDYHVSLMGRVARHRDREAFEELFVHYGPRVKAVMMKGGASADQAEDLMQDVMMTVWRKVQLYAPERGSVGAWIFTIARNARIDHLRRGSSRPYEDVEELEIASDEADGEDHAFSSQRAALVAEALSALPSEQRQIIEYAYVHDMPQSEISTKLALPLGTVKSRMRLAYAKLKSSLGELQ